MALVRVLLPMDLYVKLGVWGVVMPPPIRGTPPAPVRFDGFCWAY
jgi:hypothetical protein